MAMNDTQNLDATPGRWSRSGSVVSDLIILILILVAIVGAAAGNYFVAAICGLVLALTFISRAWTRLALVDVTYSCQPSGDRFMAGDIFDLTLTVENRKPLPLPWLSLAEGLPDGLALAGDAQPERGYRETTEIRESASLGQYERVRYHHRIHALKRGYYGFGPTRIVSGDIFGFYQARLETPKRAPSLVVYPRVVPLPDFDLPPFRPIGDIASRARLLDDPTRPSGLREYRPGDAARQIDWKATARRNSVFVRTYDASHSQQVVVLLECNTGTRIWRSNPEILEAAVTAAASVAMRSSELGYAVGLVCNGNPPGGPAPPIIAPGAGPDQLNALMSALAGVNTLMAAPLEEMLMRYGGEALPAGATIIYIAGMFRPSTVDFVIDLGRRQHRVVSLWVGGGEPPEIPGLAITDYRARFAAPGASDA